jgi:hypothetical protein
LLGALSPPDLAALAARLEAVHNNTTIITMPTTMEQADFSDKVDVTIPPNFFEPVVGRYLPPNGRMLDLSFLQQALRPTDSEDFVEVFIPQKIYIRQEMEKAFQELVYRGPNTTTVFSGSPGVGKSILMFLIVLYRAAKKGDKVTYIRCTDDSSELISAFVMEYKSANLVHVRFNREIPRRINVPAENDKLRGSFRGLKWTNPRIVNAVDGPKSPEFHKFSKMTYGCTSGAGIQIKHHMSKSTTNVVMGGWKKLTLARAIIAELDLDPQVTDEESTKYFDRQKFGDVYFVTGGRIRGFREFYEGEIDTEFADQIVTRVSNDQASLSLSHKDCRSTDKHVDSLRTMFRDPNRTSTDAVIMHVDSGYLIRKLRDKISGEELFDSYKKAEASGDKGAQANYFEELLHWCFRSEGISEAIVGSVHAEGKGAQGVAQLAQKNWYWIPSVPNFVNIDSAVVGSDDKVWCYQFTTSTSHTYKKRRLKSQFLDKISVLESTNEVVIVFVYPAGINFSVPDTGGEVETEEFAIDVSTCETVKTSVRNLASEVAVP